MPSAIVSVSEVIYGLITILGLIGNGLVLYVILTAFPKKLRSSLITRCIFHITLADLLALIALPFFISALHQDYWPFGGFLCRFFMGIMVLQQFSKAFLLVLLGLTAYAGYKGSVIQLTTIKVTIMLSSCWLLGLIMAIPIFSYAHSGSKCNIFWPEDNYFYYNEAFTLAYTICAFLFPIIILILLFKQKDKEPYPDENLEAIEESVLMATIMIGVQVSMMFLHVIAQWIFTFNKVARGVQEPEWKIKLALVSGWIWYCTSAIFPLIYTFFWIEFSKGFASIFQDSGDEYKPVSNHERFGSARILDPPSGPNV